MTPTMEVDRYGLEILDRGECLRLLGLSTLGRIGFTSGALPAVLPVNFSLDGERILVRTGRGGRLDTALQNAVVAFETDDFDSLRHAGWSVAVTGVATLAGEPPDPATARREPVVRWTPPGDEVVIAISTEIVSGRRAIPGSIENRW